jgi:hypothetical protein
MLCAIDERAYDGSPVVGCPEGTEEMMKLTETQTACLRHFVAIDGRGAADGFKFGAATLTSLRKLGLLEKFKGYPWPGAKEHVMWRATDAGRAEMPAATPPREAYPLTEEP